MLGVVMTAAETKEKRPCLFDLVAVLSHLPAQRIARGQVGTVVEKSDDAILLVEFSDDQGRAYMVAPCPRDDLLTVHYVPEAA